MPDSHLQDLRIKAEAAEQKLELYTKGPSKVPDVVKYMKTVNGAINKLSSKHGKLIDTHATLVQVLAALPANFQGVNVRELGM